MTRKQHVPMRRCVVCRKQESKRNLVRLIRTYDGDVELDLTGKHPGRGAYVCVGVECWDQALKRPVILERALHTNISSGERDRLSSEVRMLV